MSLIITFCTARLVGISVFTDLHPFLEKNLSSCLCRYPGIQYTTRTRRKPHCKDLSKDVELTMFGQCTHGADSLLKENIIRKNSTCKSLE